VRRRCGEGRRAWGVRPLRPCRGRGAGAECGTAVEGPGRGARAGDGAPPGARAVASGGGERAVVAGKIAPVEKTKRPTRALEETMRDFYSGARRQDLWRRAPVHVGATSAATSALGAGIDHATSWRRAVLPRRHSL
jgi:hypothetical protein